MANIGAPKSSDTEADWEIWYQDTFDRDCPRRVEIVGQGLLPGLIELWARHLFETVQANGQKGFSHFNLWWKQERRSIEVIGEWAGQVRLREWVYGASQGPLAEDDQPLLKKIAAAHRNRIVSDDTSERILAAATAAGSREEFEAKLPSLE